jgi:hypothetical protein
MSKPASSPVKNEEQTAEQKEAARTAYAEKTAKETLAYFALCASVREAGKELSFGVLANLAASLGRNSKLGRPSMADYMAFTSAICERPLSHAQGEELARLANKSVPKTKDGEDGKPVALITAKRSENKGAQSYKFNSPAMQKDFIA